MSIGCPRPRARTDIPSLSMSVGPKKTVAPFIPSGGDDEKGEFNKWAAGVLTGKYLFVLPTAED